MEKLGIKKADFRSDDIHKIYPKDEGYTTESRTVLDGTPISESTDDVKIIDVHRDKDMYHDQAVVHRVVAPKVLDKDGKVVSPAYVHIRQGTKKRKDIEAEMAAHKAKKKAKKPIIKDKGAVSRDFADPRFTDLKYYGAIHMRQIVSVKVNGKDAMFYRSTAGTAGEYAGKWMPILG